MNTYRRIFRTKPDHRGNIQFLLVGPGDLSEQDIEPELVKILHAVDPALDTETGRLVPGRLVSEIQLYIHTTEKADDGINHIDGIVCPKGLSATFIREAISRGFKIEGNVV